MEATIHLKNIDENIISLLRNAIKIYPNAKMKVSKKVNQADEWNKEVDEMIKEYKSGELKTFKTAKEAFENAGLV